LIYFEANENIAFLFSNLGVSPFCLTLKLPTFSLLAKSSLGLECNRRDTVSKDFFEESLNFGLFGSIGW